MDRRHTLRYRVDFVDVVDWQTRAAASRAVGFVNERDSARIAERIRVSFGSVLARSHSERDSCCGADSGVR